MTYRNDHDAAVARVEALEHENARLAAELAERPAPPARIEPAPSDPPGGNPRTERLITFAICMGIIMVSSILSIVFGDRPQVQPPSGDYDAHAVLVETCIRNLAPMPSRAEVEAGPRASAMAPPEGRVVECRDVILMRLQRFFLSAQERDALGYWLATEDKLATARSLLGTAYATWTGDLDVLWWDFEVAFKERQAAIQAWRRAPH